MSDDELNEIVKEVYADVAEAVEEVTIPFNPEVTKVVIANEDELMKRFYNVGLPEISSQTSIQNMAGVRLSARIIFIHLMEALQEHQTIHVDTTILNADEKYNLFAIISNCVLQEYPEMMACVNTYCNESLGWFIKQQ